MGAAFKVEPTWLQVPVVGSWLPDEEDSEDEQTLIRELPVILPSSLAPHTINSIILNWE